MLLTWVRFRCKFVGKAGQISVQLNTRAAVFKLYTEKVFHLANSSIGRRFDCSDYDYCAMSAQLVVKAAEKGVSLERELRKDEVAVMDLIQISLQWQ